MEDEKIIELYLERDEQAIAETQKKYGRLALSVAEKILCREDSEECVNDSFLKIWNSIPPDKPRSFKAYLCRIVHNISLDRLKYNNCLKRSSGYTLSIDELDEAIPDEKLSIGEDDVNALMNGFLGTLKPDARDVFIRRYWFFDTVKEIMARYNYSEDKVSGMLARARKKLREYLKKEGYDI